MKTTTVDDFLETKVLPEYRDIVAMLRELMREMAPNAKEQISYGILAWKGKRIFAVVNPNKQGITFSFARGAQFEDKYGLLRGVGKSSKHVKIGKLEDLKKSELRYYVRQAIKLDAK